MKRLVLIVAAASVALTPIAASAAPAKATKRTITYDYSGFSNVGSPVVLFNASAVLPMCAAAKACWDFETTKGEKKIEITASNPNQGFQVFSDGTYAGNVQAFCGKGTFVVSPKATHEIHVRPALDACGSTPGSGTLTAVITGTK